MRNKLKVIAILILFLAFSLACSQGFQAKWNALTPDEKARVIINDLQSQLNTKFDEAKAIVTLKPEYQTIWKTEIVPAFDMANKALKSASILAQQGKMTPDEVYAQITPLIAKVVNLTAKLTVKK